jgi:hypothetical protein
MDFPGVRVVVLGMMSMPAERASRRKPAKYLPAVPNDELILHTQEHIELARELIRLARTLSAVTSELRKMLGVAVSFPTRN